MKKNEPNEELVEQLFQLISGGCPYVEMWENEQFYSEYHKDYVRDVCQALIQQCHITPEKLQKVDLAVHTCNYCQNPAIVAIDDEYLCEDHKDI